MKNEYADIILPLSVSGTFTYLIPPSLSGQVSKGSRVVVPFGPKKVYTGIVEKIHMDAPSGFDVREIKELFHPSVTLSERLIEFFGWLSEYYLAAPGEVIKAAMPSVMLPEGESQISRANREKKERKKKTDAWHETDVTPPATLSDDQQEALSSIKTLFSKSEVVLLHGVTSSGKTEIYIHLIKEQLSLGKQVLYMLPEIALTTQIIERLRRYFGDSIGVYHSRMTNVSRVDVWNRVATGKLNLILGVRSSVFLPFSELGLIIVDEEHDTSYKQYDPAPRYHARDAAIMLSRIHHGRTLLGSATPAIESYHNALSGKFGFVELKKRFGNVMMPSMVIADMRGPGRKSISSSHFSNKLIKAMEEALGKGEQIMLFQNRRGFSPYIICSDCGWVPGCKNCSVSHTYHKAINRMVCHYCGLSERVPSACPECGSSALVTKGFGTEKVEEEIKLIFPSSSVARMDQDTTRKRDSHSAILSEFSSGSVDILIGTQMISKGLDFENLTVVGILDADNMLHFPDFRAFERSYQMIEQVSGRAGRRTHTGKVIIQTANPSHPVLRHVIKHEYKSMFNSQLEERELFNYPPYSRLIRITLKHRDDGILNTSASRLANTLRERLGSCVLGPEKPLVMQVQKWYIKNILVKLGRDLSGSRIKEIIRKAIETELKMPGVGNMRIFADVDPQ